MDLTSILSGLLGGAGVALIIQHFQRRKTVAEAEDIENRITEAVLARAEKDMAKYKAENEELRQERDVYKRMFLALRSINIKLIATMKKAGIDPELTEEEMAAIEDTGKLRKFIEGNK